MAENLTPLALLQFNPAQQTQPANLVMDEQGFAQLYRECWKSVFGIVYHYTQDEEIAEEISQDLFASLWERREKLVIKTTIEQYLKRAAKLEAFDYVRTSINHRAHIDCMLRDVCDSHHCTEQQVLFNELKGTVDSLVEELPCRCREVYRMSQEQGLNNKAIASTLSISEKTVEYHLYKALQVLKLNLQSFR